MDGWTSVLLLPEKFETFVKDTVSGNWGGSTVDDDALKRVGEALRGG